MALTRNSSAIGLLAILALALLWLSQAAEPAPPASTRPNPAPASPTAETKRLQTLKSARQQTLAASTEERSPLHSPLGSGPLVVFARDSAGDPLPLIEFRANAGGRSWSTTTDAEGRARFDFPPTLAHPRSIERLLPLEASRNFRCEKLPIAEGGLLLAMDDVGYWGIRLKPQGELSDTNIQVRLSPVSRGKQHVLEVQGELILALPSRHRSLIASAIPINPVTDTANNSVGSLREQATGPGTYSNPAWIEFDLEQDAFVLRGELSASSDQSQLSFIWERQRSLPGISKKMNECNRGGRFEAILLGHSRPITKFVVCDVSKGSAMPRVYSVAFEPPLSPGIHELGRLEPIDPPLIAKGSVRGPGGIGIPGLRVVPYEWETSQARALEQPRSPDARKVASESPFSSKTWFASETDAEGRFGIYGSLEMDAPALLTGNDTWRLSEPVPFKVGDDQIQLRVDRPQHVRYRINFADLQSAKGLRTEIWHLPRGVAPIYDEQNPSGVEDALLVPGDYELRLIDLTDGACLISAPGRVLAGEPWDPRSDREAPFVDGWEALTFWREAPIK